MTDIKLYADNVAVTLDDLSPVTTDFPSPIPSEGAVMFRSTTAINSNHEGSTFTASGSILPAGGAANHFTTYGIVDAVTANKVQYTVHNGGGLHNFRFNGRGAYVGGTVTALRASNGQLDQITIADGEITDASVPSYEIITGTDEYAIDPQWEYSIPGFYTDGRPMWARCFAVSGTELGTPSDWVTFNIPASSATADNTGNVGSAGGDLTSGGSLAAPANPSATFGTGDVLILDADDVASADGYVWQLSLTDPQYHDALGDCLTLANATGLAAGDLLIQKTLITQDANEVFTPRSNNSRTKPFFTKNADDNWEWKRWVTNPDATKLGPWYVEITVPAGGSLFLEHTWAAGKDQDFYTVPDNQTFRLNFWAEADEALTLTFNSGEIGESDQTQAITTTATEYNLDREWGTVPETMAPRSWSLTWNNTTGHEVKIRFAEVRPYIVEDPDGFDGREDSMIYSPLYRNHATIKRGKWQPTVESLVTTPVTRAGGSIIGHLNACEQLGIDAWAQIEWLVTDDELADIGDTLGNYLSTHDSMHVEIGNETWTPPPSEFIGVPAMTDSVTATEYTSGEVYGMICEWMRRRMIANSAAFAAQEHKVVWVYGGRARTPSYGAGAANTGIDFDKYTIANYTGGRDVGSDIPSDKAGSMVGALSINTLVEQEYYAEHLTVASNAGAQFDNYEAGPGSQVNLSGAPYVTQEVFTKSRINAVACVANMNRWAELGGRFNIFSNVRRSDYFSSHRWDGTEHPWTRAMYEITKQLGPAKVYQFSDVKDQTATQTAGLGSDTLEGPIKRIHITGYQSIATPSTWIFSVCNLFPDYTIWPTDDPLYDASDDGRTTIAFHTGFASATGCEVWDALVGNPRAHNKGYLVGHRYLVPGEVDGDGQTGTTLSVANLGFRPDVGMEFTVDGHTYEIASVSETGTHEYDLGLTSALQSSPAGSGLYPAELTWADANGAFIPDSNRIDFNYDWTTKAVPSDVSKINVEDLIGENLRGANAVYIKLTGVVLA